jgi:hypothetical protein
VVKIILKLREIIKLVKYDKIIIDGLTSALMLKRGWLNIKEPVNKLGATKNCGEEVGMNLVL